MPEFAKDCPAITLLLKCFIRIDKFDKSKLTVDHRDDFSRTWMSGAPIPEPACWMRSETTPPENLTDIGVGCSVATVKVRVCTHAQPHQHLQSTIVVGVRLTEGLCQAVL